MFWVVVVRLQKLLFNTMFNSIINNQIDIISNWHLRDTKSYNICRVHQTKLYCTISHRTIIDMVLSHESIVPSSISWDVSCIENTYWIDYRFISMLEVVEDTRNAGLQLLLGIQTSAKVYPNCRWFWGLRCICCLIVFF